MLEKFEDGILAVQQGESAGILCTFRGFHAGVFQGNLKEARIYSLFYRHTDESRYPVGLNR
jgi:hypothetical protein